MSAPPPQPLIFIESNTSGTGRLFVAAARELGFEPFLVTADPGRYSYLSLPGAPQVLPFPRVESDLVERVLRNRFPCGIAGITSSSEYFAATAANLASRFGLPGPDPAAVARARDKSYQRHRLTEAGFPTPAFQVAGSAYSAISAARTLGFPVVVKPLDGSGSVGVKRCENAADVESHVAALLASRPAVGRRVLVESFIDGPEFSVEVFSGQIVGITRKHVGEPPWFVETGHDYPALISDSIAQTLTDTALRATTLLHLDWGPLHWELRLRGGRAYVMEVNPRLAGGFIPELVRHAQGIDLIRQTLLLAVGRSPNLQPAMRRHASIRFLPVPRAGCLLGIEGIEDACRLPETIDVQIYRSIGDNLEVCGDFRDRAGHVIACACQFEAAALAAERARNAVRLSIASETDRDAALACVGASA